MRPSVFLFLIFLVLFVSRQKGLSHSAAMSGKKNVYYKSPLPSPYRKLLPNLEPYRMPQPVKRSPPSDLIRQQPPREHQPGRYTILFKDLEKVTKSILVSGSGLERRTHENETIIHPRHFDGRRNSCRWKRKERLRGEEIVTPPAGGSQ